MTLLSKTRQLNRLLQQAAGQAVNFMEMAQVLKETLHSNVFVFSRKGKMLGYAFMDAQEEKWSSITDENHRIPHEYNQILLQIHETYSNTEANSSYEMLLDQLQPLFGQTYVTIIPIIGGGDRLGSLVIERSNHPFVDDDLILSEYGSTIIGMEILRMRAEEAESEARSKAAVQVAVGSLSYSESEAAEHIFEELDGMEGLLVASKIADRAGITRSVIVNALRKLESAGVIETRSLGMKGTYIKILNEQLVQEFSK